MTRRKKGPIVSSHARAVTAIGRTATTGVDRTAVAPVKKVDDRPLCAWSLRETEDTTAAGFARFFEVCSDHLNAPVLRNALVAARAGKFSAFEQDIVIGGETQALTVIGQAGRESETVAFIKRLATTKPENLLTRWFPAHGTAAVWLWYEIGKLMAWTYYDIQDQLWAALEGEPGADFVLQADEEEPEADVPPEETSEDPTGQSSEDDT